MVEIAEQRHVGESNEAVFEVRYRPNARILDHRGAWAELLSAHMELPHWRIVENRIDMFSKDETEHLFVGFRNSGAAYQDVPSSAYFSERLERLLKRLFALPDFGETVQVERLGVRLKLAVPFDGTFGTLVTRFTERYVQLTQATRGLFDRATLVDVGAPLNFTDELGRFNTGAGPMALAQFREFFRKKEGLPEVGLFVDVDYWLKPDAAISGVELIARTKAFCRAADGRATAIRNCILGA